MLKADSVYKLGKNYNPQVYVEECKCTNAESQRWRKCKCTNAESQRWSMLSVSGDDEGFFCGEQACCIFDINEIEIKNFCKLVKGYNK